MTEVIESLALSRAKAKLKLEDLRSSKTDVKIVIDHLEALIKDYDRAIEILTQHTGKPGNKTETVKLR